MATPVYELKVHVILREAPPEDGLRLVTRLARHAGSGTWDTVDFIETVWRGVDEGVAGTYEVPSGLYGVDFRTGGRDGVEGFVIEYSIEVVGLASPFDMGAVTVDPTFGLRRVFYLSDSEPYITRGSSVPAVIPVPPTIPDEIVASTDDPWWKPYTDALLSNGGALVNTILGLGGLVSSLFTPVSDFFKDPIGNVVSGVPNLLRKGSNAYAEQISKDVADIFSGSPDWVTEAQKPYEGFFITLGSTWETKILAGNWLPKEPTLSGYYDSAQRMAKDFVTTDTYTSILGIVSEMASFGQVEGVDKLIDELMHLYGIDDLTRTVNMLPIQKGILLPYEHAVNYIYPNELPTTTELINMVVKEKLPLDVFKEVMQQQGLKPKWSQLVWDAHFIAPDYDNVRMAYHRGNITEEQLLPMLKRVDFDPEFNEQIWLPNLWTIPPYTDLINMRVKEVISKGLFAESIRTHGYNPIWAERIWKAHFFPPTQGDIITAYRRRIPVSIPEFDEITGVETTREVEQLTLNDVHQLMVLVDLDARYQSIFDTRLYNDPTIRQARYMFETGAIDADTVHDIVRRSGLDPQYLDPMTEYLIEFTEREYRRRYLTALQGGVQLGVYTPEELTEAVTEAGFPEGVAKWMLMTAEVRMKVAEAPKALAKPKLLSISDLKKAYLKDFIDDPTLRLRLDGMGYEFEDIELLVRLLDEAKVVEEEGRRQVVLTTSQLINAFRYGEMTESDLRDRLMLKGLALDEAQLIIDTKKKQWGMGGEA